jgi:hypothetical protein
MLYTEKKKKKKKEIIDKYKTTNPNNTRGEVGMKHGDNPSGGSGERKCSSQVSSFSM